MSKFKVKDLNRPIHKWLADKYNLPVWVIVYLRLALVNGMYTRESLITKINVKNSDREEHLRSRGVPEYMLKNIEDNMESDKIILEVLNGITEEQLEDILQQE